MGWLAGLGKLLATKCLTLFHIQQSSFKKFLNVMIPQPPNNVSLIDLLIQKTPFPPHTHPTTMPPFQIYY